MSKEDKVSSIYEKLEVEILKMTANQHLSPLVPTACQHVVQLKHTCLNDNVVSAALATLTLEDLKRLQTAATSSHNEGVRIRALSSVLFKTDLEPIKCLRDALDSCKEGIEVVTTCAVYKEFVSEYGRIEWARFVKAISDACLQKAFEAGRGAG